MDAEPLERGFDPLEHAWQRIAVLVGKIGDVAAVVAVLGNLPPFTPRLDGGPEPVDLGARVVVVILALDAVARELEQAGDAVAERTVSPGGDGDRARRIRGHH